MGFLIKTALLLAIVVMLIPADEAETRKLAAGRSVTTFEAFGLAQAALDDVRGFCGRNPTACETGQVALSTFEAKARTGARLVYDYLDPAGNRTEPHPPALTSQPMPPPIKVTTVPVATGTVPAKTPPVKPTTRPAHGDATEARNQPGNRAATDPHPKKSS